MKSHLITMLKKGRVLDWAEDRTGAYSLRNVNKLPKLRRVPRVAANAPAPQPSLFEAAKAPEAPPPERPADRTDPTNPANPTDATNQAKQPAEPPKPKAAVNEPSAPGLVPIQRDPPHEVGAAVISPPNADGGPSRLVGSPALPALTKAGFLHSAKLKWKARFAAALAFVPGRLARLRGRLHSPSADARPRAQAELALEKVKVMRNDLSDADLVVVAVQARPEDPCAAKAEGREPGGNPWTRVAARWIKLKGPAGEAGAAAVTPPANPAPPAELARTQPLNPC
jgi:hypothetical protein